MTTSARNGAALFASFAYPPNELGYCGPPDASVLLGNGDTTDRAAEIAGHARGFDGAWPYLDEIATAAGLDDQLDTAVVHDYWLGGPLLDRVDGDRLVGRLRTALAGQPTGLLDHPGLASWASADHSFHVFAVYPWIRFLHRGDPTTPLRILQSCRIRWGTVDSVDDQRAVMVSRPLVYDGRLALGDATAESVCWNRDGTALTSRPVPGEVVAAHWDWVCATLGPTEVATLAAVTAKTLALVNRLADPGRLES